MNRHSPLAGTSDFVFGESVPARYERENIRSVGASGRVSVNAWGAITYAGLGPLFRITGRLTAEVYNEIIDLFSYLSRSMDHFLTDAFTANTMAALFTMHPQCKKI
ncbi:hypothetical protein HPB51_005985 [Rhipicephalus microplus]|uniref:Uncharacterized protein n=1 Tax=Rhipicephalus microplus TaxID=6941 RepID=A0A9J6DLS4_RHIMP|nr:hypothetical protein HPB51_005985 [Rhipicephalus microplus]